MRILKDIPELVEAGVITQETADRIRDHYKSKSGSSANRLFIVFGILGALLVGLGIILIIAHNWDDLSRSAKTFFAFLPLVTGQLLCGYVLLKRYDSVAWIESTTTFLFFAIGACISLVSQIYNIPGNLGSFLLTWSLLSLPLVYVMKSSAASLLYLCWITWYAAQTGYWSYPASDAWPYWPLLAGALPHYYMLYRKRPESNFMTFHNWIVPLSMVGALGTMAKSNEELMFIAYFSLFGLFYLAGNSDFFTRQTRGSNGYRIIGSIGTMVLLLSMSFDWFWEELRRKDFQFNEVFVSPEFFAAVVISLAAGLLLYQHLMRKPLNDVKPMAPAFILFIGAFIVGLSSPVAGVLINLYVLAFGILTIRNGARHDHLGVLNYGLLTITALVICRFFDTDLSFVTRGILFLAVGTGFFAANYRMLKKRRANE